MAKYVFLTYGHHIYPNLAVAQALVQQKQEVIFYQPEAYQEAVEATGAVFRGYDSKLKDVAVGPTTLPSLLPEESHYVLPQVLERIRADAPDVIVYGSSCVWAQIAVQVLKISAVTLHQSYVMNTHFNLFSAAHLPNEDRSMMEELRTKVRTGMAELCAAYHVPPLDLSSLFLHAEPLNIVFLPKLFQPRAETFDHRYLFVGPCLAPRQEASSFPWNRLRSEQPLLYISLGTVANNQPEFFKLCFAALGASNYQVVLSGGGQFAPDAFAPVPANFLTALYVPQTEMLARAQVFVTHGGMNSVMESLSYGVPMVAIPQQMEQARTAQRLVELGLAIMLAKETVTATELREAIEQVASDATFRQRAQQMQQVMHDAGGAGQAAEAIIQFAEKQERGNNV